MKYRGIIRNVDELGRVVIPVSMRKALGMQPGTPIEIINNGEAVVLVKADMLVACQCCGASDELVQVADKTLCLGCITQFNNVLYKK